MEYLSSIGGHHGLFIIYFMRVIYIARIMSSMQRSERNMQEQANIWNSKTLVYTQFHLLHYIIFYDILKLLILCFRGLVAIEFLKALEKQSQCRIHELFDYVCGVSTGALLAAMVCLYKIPLDRCEDLYKDCATRMFTRNRVVGTTKLVWNHGFYDSHSWEEILKYVCS